MAWNSRQLRAATLFIFMICLPSIVIAIRVWACWIFRHTRRVGLDDIFAFAALPFAIALNASMLWYLANGLGEHENQVSTDAAILDLEIGFIGSFLYDVGITLPKLSVLFFYSRVFEHTSKSFRRTLWLLGVLVVAWLVVTIFLTAFQCYPARSAWDATVKPEHCIGTWNFILGTAIMSTAIDLGILLAPLPILFKLQMKTSRKFFISLLFVAGYSVIVCSIGRLVTLAKIEDYRADSTWLLVPYVEWVASEPAVSVVGVSLPILYHFFKSTYEQGLRFALTGRKPLSGDRPIKPKSSFFSFSSRRLRAEIRGYKSTSSEGINSTSITLKQTSESDEPTGTKRDHLVDIRENASF